jgi:hypothetical protein
MDIAFVHCFLRCEDSHNIPLPHPSLLKTNDNPQLIAKADRTVVVVCPDCGLGSSYSAQDVRDEWIVGTPNLFQAGECLFVSTEVECDAENCEARKVIHVVQGVSTGTWRPKVVPRDWHFSDTATCSDGHKLRFDPAKVHFFGPADYPF